MRPDHSVKFLDRTTPPHISTLILLAGISAINMSMFLPALNEMALHFNADYGLMQLAVSAYLAVTAVLQIVVGPLSDKFGRRPVMLGALGIFVLSSIAAILAPTAETFLIARMFQGAVATAIVLTRAVVRDMVPAEHAASMIGYVTMGMSLVPMVGPMLGGVLADAFGWQSIFGFLAGAGAVMFLLAWADQGETMTSGGMSFRQQLADYPELLRSHRFWGYAGTAALTSGAFFAYLGGASFVAEEVYGLTPVWTGVALGAPAIGYGLGNYISGRYSVAVGMNRMVLAGSLIVTGGLAVPLILGLSGIDGPFTFFPFCTLMGLGNGMVLPNTMAGILSVRPRLAGTASGLGGAIMIGGGAALAALAGSILDAESGSVPLLWIMCGSSAGSVVSIIYVIQRDRVLAKAA